MKEDTLNISINNTIEQKNNNRNLGHVRKELECIGTGLVGIKLKAMGGNSEPIPFVIDTGASVNLLRWREAVNMGMNGINTKANMRLAGISGKLIETLGSCQIELDIGGICFPTVFHLVQELALPGLLGAEFLQQYVSEINYKERYVTLDPQEGIKELSHQNSTEIKVTEDGANKACQGMAVHFGIIPTFTDPNEFPHAKHEQEGNVMNLAVFDMEAKVKDNRETDLDTNSHGDFPEYRSIKEMDRDWKSRKKKKCL